jgi:hypothetical protein
MLLRHQRRPAKPGPPQISVLRPPTVLRRALTVLAALALACVDLYPSGVDPQVARLRLSRPGVPCEA